MRLAMWPTDSALPGLSAALDADAMLRALSDAWSKARIDAELQGLRVSRYRHRPGSRAIVLYEADYTLAGSTAPQTNFCAGYIYPGKKAKRICHEEKDKTGFARPVHLPELGMALRTFPHDTRLPELAELVARPPEEVCQALAAGERLVDAEPVKIDVLRYRPGLRAAIRYKSDDQESVRSVYLKAFGEGDAAATYERQLNLERQCGSARGGLGVVRPVAKIGGAAIAYAPASGQPLVELLKHRAEVDLAAFGDLLARFHAMPPPSTQQPFGERISEKAESAVKTVSHLVPEAAPAAKKIAEHVARASDPAQWRLVHNDLKPEHVFWDGTRFELIDTDSVGAGDPLIEIGGFLARLDALIELEEFEPRSVMYEGLAFLDGYFDGLRATNTRRLSVGFALGSLLIAKHLLQRLWPNADRIVKRRLMQAAGALDTGALAFTESMVVGL